MMITGGAERLQTEKGVLIINNKQVSNATTVLFGNTAIFPLRTIFEELGALVQWQEETGDVLIFYRDETYICQFRPIPPPNEDASKRHVFIKNIKSKDSNAFEDHIQLNSMSSTGLAMLVNDHTYLGQETATWLMKYFGFSVEVDTAAKIARIYSI